MSLHLEHLNPEQLAAVTAPDEHALILAGAGSGKTRVLTTRIAWLIKGGRASPANILAVTFTNKAAGEMRHRLRELLGDAADAMWIGTFHATCARLLRRYADKVGLTKSFVIFDDDDQMRLVEKLLKETGLDDQVSPRTILSRFDRAKNKSEDPRKLQTGMYDDVVLVWMGEFGRTPRINQDVGRDHWAASWSVVMGGGGLKSGIAVGETDKEGTSVVGKSYLPGDVWATAAYALGIPLDTIHTSSRGRPMKIANGGQPIAELIG